MNRTQYNGLFFLIVILSCLPPSRFYRARLNSSIFARQNSSIKLAQVHIQPKGAGYGIGGGRAATATSLAPARGGLRMVFFDFDETITKTSGLNFEECDDEMIYWWFLFGFHNEIAPPSTTGHLPFEKRLPARVEVLRRYLSRLKDEGVRLAILSHHQVNEASGMEVLVKKLEKVKLLASFDEIWVKSRDKRLKPGYDKWPAGRVEATSKQAAMNLIALLQETHSEQLMVLVDDDANNLEGLPDAKNLSTVKDGESRNGIYGFRVEVAAIQEVATIRREVKNLYRKVAEEKKIKMKQTQTPGGFAPFQMKKKIGGFAPLLDSNDFDQLIKLFK